MELTKKQTFDNAIIVDMTFKDGTSSKLITIFNKREFDFEELIRGINEAIQRTERKAIATHSATVGSIKKNRYEPEIFYSTKNNNGSD